MKVHDRCVAVFGYVKQMKFPKEERNEEKTVILNFTHCHGLKSGDLRSCFSVSG